MVKVRVCLNVMCVCVCVTVCACVWLWEKKPWLSLATPVPPPPPSTLPCNLLPGKHHVGTLFQRHRINKPLRLTRKSRERRRSLCARLLWEFSKSRGISEVSHACCCGVCPFRSLPPCVCVRACVCVLLLPAAAAAASPPAPLSLSLSLSLRLPHPPPFSPSPSSLRLQSASCCLGGLSRCSGGERERRDTHTHTKKKIKKKKKREEEGYREYWSFGGSLWKMAPVVTGWVWDSGGPRLGGGSGVAWNPSYRHELAPVGSMCCSPG